MLNRDGNKFPGGSPPELPRVVQIATQHIWYARRHPERMTEIAQQLGVSEETALALAIADEVCEVFKLIEREAAPE